MYFEKMSDVKNTNNNKNKTKKLLHITCLTVKIFNYLKHDFCFLILFFIKLIHNCFTLNFVDFVFFS